MTESQNNQKKILVTIKESSEAQLEAALDYAEIKLSYAEIKGDDSSEFEIYAFGNAVGFFVDKKWPIVEKVKGILAEYPRLKIFVCEQSQTLQKGEKLLKNVEVLNDCDKQIQRRLDAGWFEFEVGEAGYE